MEFCADRLIVAGILTPSFTRLALDERFARLALPKGEKSKVRTEMASEPWPQQVVGSLVRTVRSTRRTFSHRHSAMLAATIAGNTLSNKLSLPRKSVSPKSPKLIFHTEAAGMGESKINVTSHATTDELHLLGGLRAWTDPSSQLVVQPTSDGKSFKFPATNASMYVDTFRKIGTDLIGWERISLASDHQSSMWHVSDPNQGEAGPLALPADQWSAISHAARRKGQIQLAETARNISFSLQTSSLRLRDISREYGRQNLIAVRSGYKEGTRFSNVETFELFMARHSFLVEMGSLRDYLARFISTSVLPGLRTDSMWKLCKKLRRVAPSHPVGREVLRICDERRPDGWMARLGRFRDVIVHETPIRSIGPSTRLTVKASLVGEHTFLLMDLGIPSDPVDRTNKSYVDALTHFRVMIVDMLQFARFIAASSPVPPEIPQFEERDLR